MKNIISFQRAAQLSLYLFGIIALFHLAVIIGIVIFDYAPIDFLWGGRMASSEQLLRFELISLVVILLCLVIVLIRVGRIKTPALVGVSRIFLWILFILFTLNTLGNILAKTTFEKSFAVVTALLAFLCLRMALEPQSIKDKQ